MPKEKLELNEILARLEKVESENRILKRAGLVAVLLASVVFAMAQAKPNRTIEAEEFVLRDASGKRWAALQVGQAEATSLDPGGPAPNLTFYGKNGEERASIGATPIASSLLLYDFAGKPRVTLGNLGTNVPMIQLDSDGAMAQLLVSMDGPHLAMEDKEGFAIEVGNSSTLTTKTGQTHHNSAASVVLFGKDKKVLWSAP